MQAGRQAGRQVGRQAALPLAGKRSECVRVLRRRASRRSAVVARTRGWWSAGPTHPGICLDICRSAAPSKKRDKTGQNLLVTTARGLLAAGWRAG